KGDDTCPELVASGPRHEFEIAKRRKRLSEARDGRLGQASPPGQLAVAERDLPGPESPQDGKAPGQPLNQAGIIILLAIVCRAHFAPQRCQSAHQPCLLSTI